MSVSMKLAALLLGLFAVGQDSHPGVKRLSALKGNWEGSDGTKIHYKVTSSGSTVQETLNHSGGMEMVTMYHADGDDLVMTHYCALGNQPRMRAKKSAEGPIRFVCEGGSNMDCKVDAHMHELTLTFTEAGGLKHEWTLFEGGKKKNTVAFTLTRKK